MKVVSALLIAALLVVTGVLVFLLKSGAALRPAGVIKPSEIGGDPDLIGRSIALRLFPDFQAARNVIWYLDDQEESFARVPQITHLNFQSPQKPPLQDLRKNPQTVCNDGCWYIQWAGAPLPEALLQKLKTEPPLEVFVQYFDRDQQVPQECESEKILETKCVEPVSVREVRRKLKTPAPHFFMRRYLDSQFYLFIEKYQ